MNLRSDYRLKKKISFLFIFFQISVFIYFILKGGKTPTVSTISGLPFVRLRNKSMTC
jgi:hypothetical protein